MRIRHKVNVQIYDDADGNDVLFAPKDTLAEIIIDAFKKETSGKISVAANATESVPFGDVGSPAKGAYLMVNAECTISINGGPAIQLRKGGTTAKIKFFIEGDITSLQITAPSSTAIEGIYAVWGEAAA